ncbi:hypothetical protein SLEP1_g2313 [Rubroshorea leprosula]|uniref:BACK domain-containing protein n=1 Tax=Rubroshorea leprosula TaxID=152421 RepID=A0AAV5HGQ4_9ROSI|nr:hypothetical protein SLEP1_g2313 [Rubroshorea leprosula]
MGSNGGGVWLFIFVVFFSSSLSSVVYCSGDYDPIALDALIRLYVNQTLSMHRKGTLYSVPLPSNFSGVNASALWLSSRGFRRKGANIGFVTIPPAVRTAPSVKRIAVVYQNLGNLSSKYYQISGYNLVAPVIGFKAYDASNIISFGDQELAFKVTADPISIHFPGAAEAQNRTLQCVKFGNNGSVQYVGNMTQPNVCTTKETGHYSLVIVSSPPVIVSSPPTASPEKKGRLWRWWVIWFPVGFIGLVSLILVGVLVVKLVRRWRIRKMEKESEKEEPALMELLNFMYSNSLSVTTAPALLDVLMAADKFEVASCMRYCSRLLRNLPMTPESALLYLDLPSSVLMAEAVQPLTDAARQYLAVRYKDITKFQDEVMALPLAGIEAILASDDLQIASEDAVYDFVLKWARAQYPKLEERREVLGLRLARFIRFPYMTCRKLKKVLICNDFDHEAASKLVLEALFFKAEAPHRQRSLAAEESATLNHRFMERAYKYRPVKVVEFELPHQQCVVYLDLKREECANLFPSGRVYSQAFHLGGQGFFLSAHCNMDQQSSFHCFGLFLGMQEKGSVSFAVDYEFAARLKPTEEFVSKYKGNYTFTGGKAVGYRNLFAIPWTSFMAEDSIYFINGILHLRAELTIKH